MTFHGSLLSGAEAPVARHRHVFRSDAPRRPATRSAATPPPVAAAADDDDRPVELLCASNGKSAYCAHESLRCAADDSVPLFQRAWAIGGGTLTTADVNGDRYGVVVGEQGLAACVPEAEAGNWTVAERAGRVGLASSGRYLHVADFGGLLAYDIFAAPFRLARLETDAVDDSVRRRVAAAAAEARADAVDREELRRRFAGSSETRVVSMALYGGDPKYCAGALENARLVPAYFPNWRLRVYAAASVPADVTAALRAAGADVVGVRGEHDGGAAAGMFQRFFVADDPSVDRFIVRDADSRPNARDAFAVADWCDSKYAAHSVRDHPNHDRVLNGGLWGATRRSKIAGRLEFLAREWADHDAYGADLDFLAVKVAPLLEGDLLSHDAYTCEKYGGRPFPTKRPADYQHVGQVFDAENRPRLDDIDSYLRGVLAPLKCRRRPDWSAG